MTPEHEANAKLAPTADGGVCVALSGDWRLRRGLPGAGEVFGGGTVAGTGTVRFVDGGITAWDSGLTAFLLASADLLGARGGRVDFDGLPEGAAGLMRLALAVPEKTDARRTEARRGWLSALGEAAWGTVERAVDMLAFLGEVVLATVRVATGRGRMRLRDLLFLLQTCGADALPIVLLINVLVGMILAFVGVVQLQQFGAAIFVASLVALAMLREMGALMTGIILSGRTGAAFAAQLGSMQANEEIDAFEAFAIPPMEFLVLPRVLALVFMMPLLTVFADAIGILGGMLVAALMMDLSLTAYWRQTLASATLTHFLLGVGKSFVFGGLIALAGCYQGMRCGRNAQAVGQATTRAVVAAITLLILADAAFAILCNELHI